MTGSALRMSARAESVAAAAAGRGASRQGRSSIRSRCARLLAAVWHFLPWKHLLACGLCSRSSMGCWPEAVSVPELGPLWW